VVGAPEPGSSILGGNILLIALYRISGGGRGLDNFIACHPEGAKRPKDLVEILHHSKGGFRMIGCERGVLPVSEGPGEL
jgi:hypothetical protein